MLLIKSPNISPKKRWQILVSKPLWKKKKINYFLYKVKTYRRKTLSGKIGIAGLKFYKKTYMFNYFRSSIKLLPFVVTSFCFNKCPLKEYSITKSLFGQIRLFQGSDFVRPGFIYYPLNILLEKNMFYGNQFVTLSIISINSIISNVFNSFNNNTTYATSSGSFALKRKSFKKNKLIWVELPSGCKRVFPAYTMCLLSSAKNMFTNKTILGGWGVFQKQKKKINVRGVAMNPVDHPNGGRTKAKQPELSPWGWVAKLNK